jgi:hypothetical protein
MVQLLNKKLPVVERGPAQEPVCCLVDRWKEPMVQSIPEFMEIFGNLLLPH